MINKLRNMKTDICDPWNRVGAEGTEDTKQDTEEDNCFEDSFVEHPKYGKLSDSEQYLQKLYSRLKAVQRGNTRKDLVTSLSEAKEDCIARLISSEQNFQSEEEAELASNAVIRLIAPHLQALTTTELIHLLKADVLQTVTEASVNQEPIKE